MSSTTYHIVFAYAWANRMLHAKDGDNFFTECFPTFKGTKDELIAALRQHPDWCFPCGCEGFTQEGGCPGFDK